MWILHIARICFALCILAHCKNMFCFVHSCTFALCILAHCKNCKAAHFFNVHLVHSYDAHLFFCGKLVQYGCLLFLHVEIAYMLQPLFCIEYTAQMLVESERSAVFLFFLQQCSQKLFLFMCIYFILMLHVINKQQTCDTICMCAPTCVYICMCAPMFLLCCM